MPPLASANVRSRVIRALRRAGFEERQGGSHTIMVRDDGSYTTIPRHTKLKVGTLRSILKQCGLTETEYLELYR